MISDVILEIKNNQDLYQYLKYHSYWYELLKEDKNNIKEMIKELKKERKLNTEDKIIDLSNKIELLKSILEIIS